MEQRGSRPPLPEIPRLLLMRWDGIEFWKPNLCERDLGSLNLVRAAIDELKRAIDSCHQSPATSMERITDCDGCRAAFDNLSKISRRVGNDLRSASPDKSQTQLWRARHIANLLDGVEDESIAASAAAAQRCSTIKPTKEGHPASPPNARNFLAQKRCCS